MSRFIALPLFMVLTAIAYPVLAMDPPTPTPIQNGMEGNVSDVPGTLPDGKMSLLRLMPDKITTIDLNDTAAQVIVGNPEHVLGMVENARSIILIPRKPGATYIQIKNAYGKVIYERSVIVAAPSAKYIRVRKSCAAGNEKCEPFSIYYCPDICHTIEMPALKQDSSKDQPQNGPATTGTPAGANGNTQGEGAGPEQGL